VKSSVTLGSIRGIQIGVHYSWLLVFALVSWSLAVGFFPQQLPELAPTTYWIMGVVAALLLFASVLIHELAHSFVAQAKGLMVKSIILFVFGGVANIDGEPKKAGDEFLIAAVGPLASFGLAAMFLVILQFGGIPAGPVAAVVSYLAVVNALLAVFNLIPGFPLDGGRVLRSVIWGATQNFRRASQIAAGAGQIVAFLFIFGGIFMAIQGAVIAGIWLAFIGWFLNNAAAASGQHAQQSEMLRGIKVHDVMNSSPITAGPDVRVSALVNDYVLGRSVRAIPVTSDGDLLGLITINGIRQVPKEEWDSTPARFIMIQPAELRTVAPDDDLEAALKTIQEGDYNQLPVVKGRQLVGLLSRSNVMRFFSVRQELGLTAEEEQKRRSAA
jgi:Zn-dependent protease/CBS domain-containing protein